MLAPFREVVYFKYSNHQFTNPVCFKASKTLSYFGFNGKPSGTIIATKLISKIFFDVTNTRDTVCIFVFESYVLFQWELGPQKC